MCTAARTPGPPVRKLPPVQRVTGRTRGIRLAAFALAAAVLAACTGGSSGGTTATTSTLPNDPAPPTTVRERRAGAALRVGVVLPVTGPDAAFGAPLSAGIELAKQQIDQAGGVNGQPIELVTALDESKDLGALGQKILDGELDALVGPASSKDALAIAETVNDAQVVTCSPTAGSVALSRYGNRYLFRTIPSDAMEGAALAKAIERSGLGLSGPGPVAVLYPDDDYGRAIFDRLGSQLNPQAARLVYSAPYDADATVPELDALAGQLDGAERTGAVVIGLPDGGGRVLARLRAAPGFFRISRVYVSSAMREPTLYEKVAPGKANALQNVYGVSPLADPLLASFTAALRAARPDGGSAYAAYAYDCLNLVALAAQAAGSNDPRVFRDRLADVSQLGAPCDTFAACAERLAVKDNIDYGGVSGPVDIDASGDVTSARYELFTFDENGRDVRATVDFLVP